jgi:hypothetical protein
MSFLMSGSNGGGGYFFGAEFNVTASLMSALKAASLSLSPSLRSMARRVFAGVEEALRVFELGALGKGEFDDGVVGFARTDDAAIGPNGDPPPLPFLHDLRIGRLDELTHVRECFAAPIAEFGDARADEFGRRLGAGGFLHRLNHALHYTRSAARRFRLAAGHSLFVS